MSKEREKKGRQRFKTAIFYDEFEFLESGHSAEGSDEEFGNFEPFLNRRMKTRTFQPRSFSRL